MGEQAVQTRHTMRIMILPMVFTYERGRKGLSGSAINYDWMVKKARSEKGE
jgi:hypothetical protein